MKLYSLHRTQIFPITIDKAWDYFSNPQNLSEITPPSMHFRPTSPLPDKMHTGLLITYTVCPFGGIPVKWVTEITHCNRPHIFVDEQRLGPYRFWHHRHLFREIDGGTEMQDIVRYTLSFDPFSRPINFLAVGPRLKMIFDFRYGVLKQKFGTDLKDGKNSNIG
jgi:ligand-binding SRPBCC domain-containing protein